MNKKTPLPSESAIHYPLGDVLPELGSSIEVAPGVRWLRMKLPFALDHINLWLLRDEIDGVAGWTIVDCGIANDETLPLLAAMAVAQARAFGGLTGADLAKVVSIESSYEWTGGAWTLDGFAAPPAPRWRRSASWRRSRRCARRARSARVPALQGLPPDPARRASRRR